MQNILTLPKKNLTIDLKTKIGKLELYRHALGHGGINPKPLSENIVSVVKSLKPQLIRIFIQEFFNIYPKPDTFDWSKLDAYMIAFEKTGAKVVASVTIKPPLLFSKVDQSIWMPNNVEKFQDVIYNLVKRYSVDKNIITHWEILNETDIGETGGTPFLITEAENYLKFYQMISKPILKAYPEAKIGGPAVANADKELLPEFVNLCAKTKIKLDFVTWHLYSNQPEQHAKIARKMKEAMKDYPGKPELMVTEWNKFFDPVSVEESAFSTTRASVVAASILAMLEEKVDWSFYYHIQDQVFNPEDFRSSFKDLEMMTEFWNKIPCRFGLFGLNEEIRPQYFVYKFLSLMKGERIESISEEPNIKAIAGYDEKQISVFAVNFNTQESKDLVLQVNFKNLSGIYRNLKIFRLDFDYKSRIKNFELIPAENREIYTLTDYYCQLLMPADSVMLLLLEK